jgi:hypothetical protein
MKLWRLKSSIIFFASWRPRKGGAVIQSESEGLRSREAKNINCSVREATPAQAGRQNKKRFLLLPFVLLRPSNDW